MDSAKILVLDDDPSLAEMLAETLLILGHQASSCQDSTEALDLLKTQTFDLIISDYRMPGLDGCGFYQRVRSTMPDLANRIVFLTGDALNHTTQAFLESTGNAYLTKPFRLDDVREVIRQALGVSTQPKGQLVA